MPVRIDAKGSKLSDSTKDYIDESCDKLRKIFDRIIDIDVILDTKEKHRHTIAVEVIAKVPQQRIIGSGETTDGNLYKAIDEAVAKAETQLRKYHDKLVDHR